MKSSIFILLILTIFACSSEDEIPASRYKEEDSKKMEISEDIEIDSKYNWEELLLTTGYVSNVQELSDFQNSQLNLIKYNFPKIETLAFDQAKRISNDYYQDTIDGETLELSGVHIFNDTTEIIEFYFKITEGNRSLTPVVLFKKFKLLGTTYID